MTRRVLFLSPLLAACNKPHPPAHQYQMRGVVLKVDASAKTATIDAEKIDGWMEAMTMEYPVPDAADLQKLKPGARITATVNVQELNYSVSNVRAAR